ncbi:MAG: site-specific DNA-methyltransferase [Gammaproteobacteria bacterium]|jgi:adenine-specific DNA-methyltransferase|nr:site-specific DNA-methyltransferase [Gammaproteobacteria bacterium]
MQNPILNAASPAHHKLDLLRQHFPQAVEVDAQGHIRINAAALQLAIDPSNPAGLQVEEDGYELRWVGKREAYHSAFVPVQKIIAPLPDDSKNWDSTGNLLIKGDNLDALRLLRHSYFGKVKLIYIDPPYNTQSDAFVYRDDFSAKQSEVLAQLGYAAENIDYIKNIYGARTHSGWLSFMYPRLLLARDLLRDDGVIFISIDDNEQAQLKLLCDEVFGQDNFVANIIWHKRYAASNDSIGIPSMHDYVLVYQKSQEFNRFLLPRTEKQDSLYKFDSNDGKGKWRPDNLTVKTVSESYLYEITNPNTGKKYLPPQGRCWLTSSSKIEEWITEGRVFFGKDNDGAPQLKRYLNEVQQGIIPNTYWSYDEVGHTDSARKELKKIFEGHAPFDNPKPTGLLKKIFQIATQPKDLIIDFFAGSGTTGEAVMRLNAEDGGNRQFILVQIPQPIDPKKQKEPYAFVKETLGKPEATIFEITAERLRRAGARIEAELAAKAQAVAVQPAQLEGFAPEASTGSARTAAVDTGFRVFDLVDDPDALILQKPLQQATQADVLALQASIATPQPSQLPRVLYNLLLAEGLPLTTPLRTVIDQHLYLAADVAFVVQALALDTLTDSLRALQAEGTPAVYLTVYAPWIADDNFMLGIKTVAETLGYSEDKLRLRG